MENFMNNTSELNVEKYGPVEALSFKEAMAQLTNIVNLLESNEIELEQSMAEYERGVALLAYLRNSLANAEQKITELMGGSIQDSQDSIAPISGF